MPTQFLPQIYLFLPQVYLSSDRGLLISMRSIRDLGLHLCLSSLLQVCSFSYSGLLVLWLEFSQLFTSDLLVLIQIFWFSDLGLLLCLKSIHSLPQATHCLPNGLISVHQFYLFSTCLLLCLSSTHSLPQFYSFFCLMSTCSLFRFNHSVTQVYKFSASGSFSVSYLLILWLISTSLCQVY